MRRENDVVEPAKRGLERLLVGLRLDWEDVDRSPTDVTDGVPSRVVTLDQNAPNPFNPATTIRYGLPRAARTSLRVYDLRGRLVRILVDGVQPAGPHAVDWDGRDDRGASVASGAYVYRLQAAGQTRQRSMMLVR